MVSYMKSLSVYWLVFHILVALAVVAAIAAVESFVVVVEATVVAAVETAVPLVRQAMVFDHRVSALCASV